MEFNKCVVIVIVVSLISFGLGRITKKPEILEKKIELIKEVIIEKEVDEEKDVEINTKIVKADGTVIEKTFVDKGKLSSKEKNVIKEVKKEQLINKDNKLKLGVIYAGFYNREYTNSWRNLGIAANYDVGLLELSICGFITANKQFGIMVMR